MHRKTKVVVSNDGEQEAIKLLDANKFKVAFKHFDSDFQRVKHDGTLERPAPWRMEYRNNKNVFIPPAKNATQASIMKGELVDDLVGDVVTRISGYSFARRGNKRDQFEKAAGRKIALYRAISVGTYSGIVPLSLSNICMDLIKSDLDEGYWQYLDI